MSTSFNPDHVRAIRTGKGQLLAWEYPATIAHELLHCCNVDHHAHWTGKWVDRGDVTWEILPDGKTLRETVAGEHSSGPPTADIPLENIKWEGGTEAVSIDNLTQWLRLADGSKRVLYVARQHGEHTRCRARGGEALASGTLRHGLRRRQAGALTRRCVIGEAAKKCYCLERKGDLLAAAGKTLEALQSYDAALAIYRKRNLPDRSPGEPPALLRKHQKVLIRFLSKG
jgi:hypothetical protein